MTTIMILALVMSALAVAGIVGTVILLVRTRRFLAAAVRVPGEITEVKSHISRDRDSGRRTRMYTPVFSFTAPDGSRHTVTSRSSSSRAPSSTEVSVLVPPEDPQRARIDRFFPVWGSTVIVGFVSLPWIIAAVVLITVWAS